MLSASCSSSVLTAQLMGQSTSSWTSTVLAASDDDVINDALMQKLFRVFLTFSDEQPDRLSRKLCISAQHAKWLCLLVARCMPKSDDDKDAIICPCEIEARSADFCKGGSVSFRDFLAALGALFPERDVLEPAIQSLFDRFVNQVLRKVNNYDSERSTAPMYTPSGLHYARTARLLRPPLGHYLVHGCPRPIVLLASGTDGQVRRTPQGNCTH